MTLPLPLVAVVIVVVEVEMVVVLVAEVESGSGNGSGRYIDCLMDSGSLVGVGILFRSEASDGIVHFFGY